MRSMNKLPLHTRVRILNMLVEGSSMRSISRVCDVSINTVTKLLVDAGRVCEVFHDEKVQGVNARRVQVDEIWSFTAAKQKNVAGMKKPVEGAGDTWTWTAIEADSKLLINWLVGDRNIENAVPFLADLKERLTGNYQLTSDGLQIYLGAVDEVFGDDIDYAMLVKIYGHPSTGAQTRYSPAQCLGARKMPIKGNPDPKHVSTSFAERQNLTMRMHMRRYTRLTNAFSRKLQNHCHMVALYTVWYNWIRIHKSLRVTPAMAAGLTDKLMDMEQVARLIDDTEMRATVQKRLAILDLPQSN